MMPVQDPPIRDRVASEFEQIRSQASQVFASECMCCSHTCININRMKKIKWGVHLQKRVYIII